MRLITSLIIILGTTEYAAAHSLDGDHAWVERLGHQFLGVHHLPLTILLIVAGLIALRICSGKAIAGNKK